MDVSKPDRGGLSAVITVIVPVYNEEENLPSLLMEIAQASRDLPISEIICVDDNSTDRSVPLLKELRSEYPALRILKHNKQAGQSAALWTGIKAAGNDIVVTMDGDGQNDPADIQQLYAVYESETKRSPRVMVLGERAKRHDNWVRRLSSRIANGIRGALLNDQTKDTGCSLKMFARKDYLALPYFDHMHRFLPALMLREGVPLVHVPVSHRPRLHGQSKYGTLDRALVGISDIRGVLWLQKRARRINSDDIYEELG
ncbi:MAG: glycosyltransferase family 2 protein [Alphaproteobacteria bacterium]|nr:glycosyltransferase family 2 protein [Alphaproteobacteria bacterium]